MDGHLLFERPLHALKSDAKLVLKQFANGANATIAKMVDVVGLKLRRILAHLQDVGNNLEEVMGCKQRILDPIALWFAHLDIELQAADARKIELARVEEH